MLTISKASLTRIINTSSKDRSLSQFPSPSRLRSLNSIKVYRNNTHKFTIRTQTWQP
jgi:hypothetical protein